MSGLRISELAERVGVPTSTVRYYERIGLVPAPTRTASGYRDYDADAEARLLFITRAKRLGLSLEETAELMTVWDGSHCTATQEHLVGLLDAKRASVAEQIRELEHFAEQLAAVQRKLVASPEREGCAPDLDCCAPDMSSAEVTFLRDTPASALPVTVPIACTLSLDERPTRVQEFASLARHAVAWSRPGNALALRFVDRADVETQIRDLSQKEEGCCAFLSFDVRRRDESLVWTITAPNAETVPALDEFLPLVAAIPQEDPR